MRDKFASRTNQVTRKENEKTTILMDNVQSLKFAYFDLHDNQLGTAEADWPKVKKVRVAVTMKDTVVDKDQTGEMYAARIVLRKHVTQP